MTMFHLYRVLYSTGLCSIPLFIFTVRSTEFALHCSYLLTCCPIRSTHRNGVRTIRNGGLGGGGVGAEPVDSYGANAKKVQGFNGCETVNLTGHLRDSVYTSHRYCEGYSSEQTRTNLNFISFLTERGPHTSQSG